MEKKDKEENKIECIGCKSYYLYCSRKDRNYVITENALEAFNSGCWIRLEDENVSGLIKLLQEHESSLEKNKANLSESISKTIEAEEPSYLVKLRDLAQIAVKSIKIP